MRSFGRWGTVAVCFLAWNTMAGGSRDTMGQRPVLLSGTLEFETAELLKARYGNGANRNSMLTLDHVWFGHTIGKLHVDAEPSSSLRLLGSFEFRQYFTEVPYNSLAFNQFGDLQWHAFYLREAQGIFSLFKNKQWSLEMALGYLPYKYNPDVRGLGEFLFRSGTYPFYLLGEFDEPFARLTGLRCGFTYANDIIGVKSDIFALTEREIMPLYDLSLAAIVGVNVMKIVDIGGGIDLARIIPVDSRITTPEIIGQHGGTTRTNTDAQYVSAAGDTGYYTFKGTKVMVRLTIDPLGMLRGDKGSLLRRIAGENGGKIYGEWAIIGIEDYPANRLNPYGYDAVDQKMPWMAGITIPSWKILDICTIEVEHYPSPYPNSYQPIAISGQPLPDGTLTYDFRRWYWSLCMEKQIVKHFSIVAQVGRDHHRREINPSQSFEYDFEEAMARPDQWGWHVKTVVNF